MKEFRFVDYHTIYSCRGSLERPMGSRACFGYVFNTFIPEDAHIIYTILTYKGVEFVKNTQESNACLFTKEEIRNHLRQLKSLYPIHYRVEDYREKDNEKYEKIKISLELKDVPPTFHKYALAWLRYIYEYPYNVILRDAYTLKKDTTFRFESISNLFNLILGCFNQDVRAVHRIPRSQVSVPMKLTEIRERIQEVDKLNDIYKDLEIHINKIPSMIGLYTVKDIEYWTEGFEQRKPIYMEAYKEIERLKYL